MGGQGQGCSSWAGEVCPPLLPLCLDKSRGPPRASPEVPRPPRVPVL